MLFCDYRTTCSLVSVVMYVDVSVMFVLLQCDDNMDVMSDDEVLGDVLVGVLLFTALWLELLMVIEMYVSL